MHQAHSRYTLDERRKPASEVARLMVDRGQPRAGKGSQGHPPGFVAGDTQSGGEESCQEASTLAHRKGVVERAIRRTILVTMSEGPSGGQPPCREGVPEMSDMSSERHSKLYALSRAWVNPETTRVIKVREDQPRAVKDINGQCALVKRALCAPSPAASQARWYRAPASTPAARGVQRRSRSRRGRQLRARRRPLRESTACVPWLRLPTGRAREIVGREHGEMQVGCRGE